MKQLNKRYYDPTATTAFGGVQRFIGNIKNERKKEKLKSFLKAQRTYTVHKPRRVNFPRRSVLVFKPGDQYQADIVDLGNIQEHNDGYRYILNCIDCFSRKAFSRAQKTKGARETADSFISILGEAKAVPSLLQTDRDKAFYSHVFRRVLKEYNIIIL